MNVTFRYLTTDYGRTLAQSPHIAIFAPDRELDPGADACEARGLFVNDEFDTSLSQRHPERKTGCENFLI
jgi:hypothetical protein